MSLLPEVPETRVLAIASHVVHGYVGNSMATFVMQSLGCEVSALNTVEYSNHTGYKQWKGTKTTADQISDLYAGLKQSSLAEFDVMLSGYMPSAEDIEAIGKIGRDLKFNASTKPGSFFWVLDPVMGDDGRLYIPEDEVPQYKALLRDADLILPNQFEAELLSETKIINLDSLATAIKVLHRNYQVPHIIITSLRLSPEDNHTVCNKPESGVDTITIIGSTARKDYTPRLFRIDIPAYPVFFSGTGDMFAALTVARLREMVYKAGLQGTKSWVSPDDVEAVDLPLAKASEKVLASMQTILRKTTECVDAEMKKVDDEISREGHGKGESGEKDREYKRHLRKTKAAEVKVVRNVRDLLDPPDLESYKAVVIEAKPTPNAGEPQPDDLGVDLGSKGEGAVHLMN